jgi:hypothetical protein
VLIPKPIRHICYFIIGFFLSLFCALILSRYLGKWGGFIGCFLYPVFSIIGGMPIDILDQWLRRKTRHPVWLMTDEGKKWLDSEEGKAWQQQHQKDN